MDSYSFQKLVKKLDSHNATMTLEQFAAAYQQIQNSSEIGQAQVAGHTMN